MLNPDEIARFGWVDYLIFCAMLLISALIGVYFARKKQDAEEFLMAGRSMTTFPVAMSLIASFMSAITLLGTPSEVYKFGCIYWLIGFSYILVMPSAAYLYLPVFWDLRVVSAFEYLEKRFHRAVRMLGSGIFILQMTMYMAIVVYAPALALSQVTGMGKYVSSTLICLVCIFYTTLGGMKAVLWTDTLQVVIMYGSIVFVIMKGCVDIGGFEYVWQKNLEGGRLELMNLDMNPGERHTLWTLIFGGYFTWITIYGCNQAQVQRYLCVKEKYMAVRALWINLVGLSTLMLICSFGGMVVYAKYAGCDPIKANIVDEGNQLFPLFVMDTLGQWPGLPGLFVAGIFSGALSTVSSGMNSLAAITLEDFLRPIFFGDKMTERQATWASKILSLFYGFLTFGLVFVASLLGDVLSAALSIFGMVGGPLLGVFTLGMFFPWANKIGAFIGTVVAFMITFWIGIGHQVLKFNKDLILELKPTSVENCTFPTNYTEPLHPPTSDPDILPVYWLSYMYYSALACFTVIIVGMIVSAITGLEDVRALNPAMISPGIKNFKNFIPTLKNLGDDFIPPRKGRDNEGYHDEIRHPSNGQANYGFAESATNLEMQHTVSSRL